MEPEKTLLQKRKTIKSSLTRIHTFVSQFKVQDDIEQLSIRNVKIETLWNSYDEVQQKLEQLNCELYEEDRGQFEDIYYEVKAKIEKAIKAFDIQNQGTRVDISVASKVKLPQLNIPTFDGNYKDWRNFYDIFTSVIHENDSISDIQKLFYLKTSVQGEALKIIDSITSSAGNYQIAYDLLYERYNNEQYIIDAHLKAMFEIPIATKENVMSLRRLTSETKQHLRSLNALKLPTDQWDAIIIYMVSTKLDAVTRREWELSKNKGASLTLNDLFKFIDHRCLSLEAIAPSEKSLPSTSEKRLKPKAVHISAEVSDQQTCELCKNNHGLYKCEKFLKQSIKDRVKTIQSLGLCLNCLKTGHVVGQCRSRYNCSKCKKRHNTLIHVIDNIPEQQEEPEPSTSSHQVATTSLHNRQQEKQVLLSTAMVLIKDINGKWQSCRALLDSASQSNFITSKLSNHLMTSCYTINIPINGINQVRTNIKRATKCELKSRVSQFNIKLDLLILNNITAQLPTNRVNTARWNIPDIPLADPEFYEPREIDLLIGAEWYLEIMKQGQIRMGEGLPILQDSELGWLLSGPLNQDHNERQTSCYVTIAEPLHTQISKFWEIEEITDQKVLSTQEIMCEEHFRINTKRDDSGRYVVKLPFKKEIPKLGLSYKRALNRFLHLEQRFKSNPELKDQYIQFIQEYIDLKHMEVIPNEAIELRSEGYYLPHHAVTKESSLTTKVRVVFDGSAKTTNGVSLNETLGVGPTIQDDIFTIVTRFRKHNIAITADIEKMYRQVLINQEDTKYQKILWRKDPADPIQTYVLKTVTYGTASAPFLAIRCLHQLAEDEGNENPRAATILKSDFYVDDMLTGAETLEEARIIQSQLINIFKQGGMKLRKWSSNSEDLLSSLSNVTRDPLLILDTSQTVKTLGLEWKANQDIFMYIIKESKVNNVTKRQILSQIAKLFDPLGLLGPIITQAKLVMQELWQLHSDWDEPVPSCLLAKWQEFMTELPAINELSIPRRILINEPINIQLHGFCDASERAYGACIYVRSSNKNNEHVIRLVCAKSKVAPLKTLTLPRLELCAAVLLAKLYKSTTKALLISFNNTYFWSDSTIALYWINTPAHTLKTFVSNRVAQIQRFTDALQWRHIRSNENPADAISRGLSPKQILDTDIWWNGPSWISKDESEWPENIIVARNIPYELAELRPSSLTSHIVSQQCNIFDRCSTFTKLQRTMAQCLRFINNARTPHHSRAKGVVTVRELHQALEALIKIAQREEYGQEIKDLKNGKQVNFKSPLKQLYPFLDNNSVLRVGGRLQNANISYDQRHPIILPAKHQLTKLMYHNVHINLLHAGTQAVLSYIRQKYWPINARTEIKGTLHKCLPCFKLKAAQPSQLMGSLPSPRVNVTRPFLNTGLDYGGPIPIRITKRTSGKAYIALFACMATKAIHIELVSSLATPEFLAALKRFTSRRGKCANIYSDNGANFKGANNELLEMHAFLQQKTNQDDIITAASMNGMQWHFIPPGAPHFGGLWEAGIKTVKYHLKRVVGESRLTFEELNTLLAQIEACINSRPLVPMSDDPTDMSYLTPSHFLIGDVITLIPEIDFTETIQNRLTRWQLVQQKMQNFWHIWSHDYLNQLQQRNKWYKEKPNPTLGAMVLLKEDNISPLRWKLGRISQLHPGKDNKVRVVTVQTAHGNFKRPITKICILPTEKSI